MFGPHDQAVVVAEAKKTGGRLTFDLLTVESLTKPNEPTFLIQGSQERLFVRDEMRSSVVLKRRYVKELE